MKILHVMISPRGEGTPRMVLDWLKVKGHEQELVFLEPAGTLLPEFEATGAWMYVNRDFPLRFTAGMKVLRLVKKISNERKPDLVISWPMGFSQWIHLGARMAGVKKLIVHAGNPPGSSFFHKYVSTYLSFWTGYLVGNKVITCSNYLIDKFNRIPFLSREQFICVYNCFRPERFMLNGVAKDPNQAIMVATLEDHKDHKTLLHAWRIIEDGGHPFTLKLAGDGSMKQELLSLHAELKLRQVEFLGSRSDVPELLNRSKLFVFSTTIQEGFGTVLLEALASRCKVVASDVPACREVLKDGKYGMLIEPANAQMLAKSIIDAMLSPDNENTVNEGVAYAAQFSPERMLNQYLEIVR